MSNSYPPADSNPYAAQPYGAAPGGVAPVDPFAPQAPMAPATPAAPMAQPVAPAVAPPAAPVAPAVAPPVAPPVTPVTPPAPLINSAAAPAAPMMPPAAPAPAWTNQPMTAPLSRPSSIDSIAGGKLTDRKTWITVLKVAAWLLTILGFIYGIISCVALSSDSYFNEGDVGAGILSMLTIWVGCFIGTAALLVLANAAEDLAAIRRQGETRR